MGGRERGALAREKRIHGVPTQQGAVVSSAHVIDELTFFKVGGHAGNHPVGGLHHADAVFRVLEVIDVGSRPLYLLVLPGNELGELPGKADLRRLCHIDERYFVYQVGQPLAFFFPREVDTPQGVFQRFFSHVYFCGERLFVQEHERPTESEVLAHVVLQVESYERFALHAVVVVAFKVHAHVRTCVDDALVDDGHHAHGVIHRVVLVLHQRYPAGRDGHGALWHVHGSEADFGTVVSLVLSGEQEFVLFRYLLGHGLGGVVQCVETILLGQGLIVQIFTQVASERFGHGEIDAPFVDGVSLHVVELSVGVRTVVGIQAV